MDKVWNFVKESYVEMLENVTWMKFNDLQKSSLVVLIASAVFAILIGVMDVSFDNVLDLLYKNLK